MKVKAMLYQITTRRFCAGVLVRNGTVYHAAPILRWAVGKPLGEVRGHKKPVAAFFDESPKGK